MDYQTRIKKPFSLPTVEVRNDVVVYKSLSKIVGAELNEIMKPCYYPKLTKYYKDLQEMLGVFDEQITSFTQSIERKYSAFPILNDKYTTLLIVAILEYSRLKKDNVVKMLYYLLAIKFYSNLVHKFFNFCQPEVFTMAMEQISTKHLFKVHGSISKSVSYLADVEYEKHMNMLLAYKHM